jgi:hypothetical protein
MPGYVIFLIVWGIPALVTGNRIHWYRTIPLWEGAGPRDPDDLMPSVVFGAMFWFVWLPAYSLWKTVTFHPVQAYREYQKHARIRLEAAKRRHDAYIAELERTELYTLSAYRDYYNTERDT